MHCYLASDFSLAASEPLISFPCKADNWTKGSWADFALQQVYWELYDII